MKKVLIVEDEKPMSKALVLKLNNAGFDAKAVFNGEEALQELEREKYDLMLLDLIMPRVDGFSVLEKIKEKGLDMTVIVTSNLGQEEDFERAKKLGAKEYFVKSDTSLSDIVDFIKKI